MTSNERAQWSRLDIDGVGLLADLAAGVSLARPVQFDEPGGWFGAPAARSVPLQVGGFTGRVTQGAGCNCSIVSFTPHAHGTHTECAGHLTAEPLDAFRVIPQRLLTAVLLSVTPEPAAGSDEGSAPAPQASDRLITRAALERAWPAPLAPRLRARAAVVRTLAGGTLADRERAVPTQNPPCPPYLSEQAARALVARGIAHLVLDVPSADRLEDEGLLSAHHIFFGLPPRGSTLAQARRREATITELAHVDASLADGWYLLSLQTPALPGDAVPSRPVLYALRTA